MHTLYVSRDWRDSYTREETMEPPDRYGLVATYDYKGQRWHVLHRVDRINWNVVVDNETFQTEWVAL